MNSNKQQRGKTPLRKAGKRKDLATDPVEVYCRIRPIDNLSAELCVKVLSPTMIQLAAPETAVAVRAGGTVKETQHTFKFVFAENASQKAVFDTVALPLADDVLHGKNALMFAYGVTSSGKTHTMMGTPVEQGVLPRCLDVIFNSITMLQANKYVFKPDKMNGFDVQSEADAMLERQTRDLMPKLAPQTPKTPQTPRPNALDLHESSVRQRVRETTKLSNVEEDNQYAVFISYVEIYNNYIYDLLEELPFDPITGIKPPQSKILREDSEHNMYISGVIEVEVKSTEEAYDVLLKGQKRRRVAYTALNNESSRSHSVFNIRLVQAPLDPLGQEVLQDKERIIVSQLALVDLAGSERTVRTNNTGERLREAGQINQSLMTLRSCIECLRENQQTGANKMVPYRDSRLTHLFKNYFDGEGKVRMVVCVNPLAEEYDETVHVMRFAEVTQEVQVARPQGPVFDIGLTPGRRRMKMQRQELRYGAEKGDVAMAMEAPVYNLGPIFPPMSSYARPDDQSLVLLASILREREAKRAVLLLDFTKKEESWRNRLVGIDRENAELRQRLNQLEGAVSTRDTDVGKLQKRIQALEKANETLQRALSTMELNKKDLERELTDREVLLQQERNQQDRLRNDYQAQLYQTTNLYRGQLEQTKQKLQEENAAQVRAKQQKLELVRNILNTDSDAETVLKGTPLSGPTTRSRLPPTPRSQRSSDPDAPEITTLTPVTFKVPPKTPIKLVTQSGATVLNKPPAMATRQRARSPPPVKPKPAVPIKNHRRSKSNEIWLEHKPLGTVDTGTVLQPVLRNKRSVTRLSEKDLVKDSSKYVLTHQELASDGELETKLVKGNIVPTVSGGASVMFSEVETLRQTSPGANKKRKSSPYRQPTTSADWANVEDRCRIAIEGHAMNKKPKSSVV